MEGVSLVLGTRERIINSFFRLALQNPYKQHFTLSEIAKEANVSRQAIYKKHYKNTTEIIEDIRYKINEEMFVRLDNFVEDDEKSPLIYFAKNVLPLAYEYRSWIRVLVTTAMDPYCERIVEEKLCIYFSTFLEENRSDAKIKLSREFQVKVISRSVISLVITWLSQEFPDPPDVFASAFLILMEKSNNELLLEKYQIKKEL